MKKLFILCSTIIFSLVCCKQTSKDYVSFSGKITNKNSDSLVVRTKGYTKTIKVDENGVFKDTLKIEKGVYLLFDGKESTPIFLENGFDLNLTLDTKQFDETIKYTGLGSEHSDFLAKKALLQEKLLNIESLSKLDKAGLDAEMENIKNRLTAFHDSNPQIDSSIINTGKRDIDPMLNFYKKYIGESISLKEDLPKGASSPVFDNYENIDGSTTSLSDLKGKYVYIDIWATWCGPCKAEIPSLKKLEKEYHGKNIQFVSISIDDDRSHGGSWDKAKEDWKAMVKDKALDGVQLFAPKGWASQFIQDFKIKGIPRFLLIDPEGKIVTPDAPRPSSASIKDLFNELNI